MENEVTVSNFNELNNEFDELKSEIVQIRTEQNNHFNELKQHNYTLVQFVGFFFFFLVLKLLYDLFAKVLFGAI